SSKDPSICSPTTRKGSRGERSCRAKSRFSTFSSCSPACEEISEPSISRVKSFGLGKRAEVGMKRGVDAINAGSGTTLGQGPLDLDQGAFESFGCRGRVGSRDNWRLDLL